MEHGEVDRYSMKDVKTAVEQHSIILLDELQLQDKLIQELRQRLDTLEGRLGPILSPAAPEPTSPDRPFAGQTTQSARSPLTELVRGQQSEVRGLISRVTFLIDHTDL